MRVLICHIPKNAGTSLGVYFLESIGDAYNFTCPSTDDLFQKFRYDIVANYRVIGGHIPLLLWDDIADVFDLILCVVRNPLDRFWSTYHFMKSIHNGEPFSVDSPDEFLKTFYLQNAASRNEQAGYIGRVNTFDAALARLDQYKNLHILRYEQLQEDFSLVCDKFYLSKAPLPKLNVSKLSKTVWDWVNTERYEKLMYWFHGDSLLHQYVSSNLRGGRPKACQSTD